MMMVIETDPIPLKADADGVVRVGGTRVTLDTVIGAFNDGATAEEIVLGYDSLRLADIYSVIGYYLRHRADVDDYLRGRRKAAEDIRRQNEARFGDMQGIRERLLARRSRIDC